MAIIVGTLLDDTSLTGAGADDTIDGLDGNDIMFGGAGNDIFDGPVGTLTGFSGAIGIDQMIGGDGNDTYFVDNASDQVVELSTALASTQDLVVTAVDYALSANVENLVLDLSGSAKVGTGNGLDNTILGNNNGDTLDGGGSTLGDTLQGGTGNDTYIVHNVNDVVIEPDLPPVPPAPNIEIDMVISSVDWSLNATASLQNVENLTLTGTTAINAAGNALDNVIIGNSANNVIDATQGGNDTLDGGLGADNVTAGAGDDTIFVDNVGDVVDGGGGTNTVMSSVTWTLGANEQILFLTGTRNINGTTNATGGIIHGNGGTNILTGGAGDDVLDGGAGADSMIGGAGNDFYFIDNVNDKVVEGAAAGTDTVVSAINYTLGTNVENLNLSGTANINGTGNLADNVIVGNSGSNTLDGGGSVLGDTLAGGDGNDVYIVRSVNDVVDEIVNQGTDTVKAGFTYSLLVNAVNVENLTLTGNTAINGTGNDVNNVIIGNSAANVIDGGLGADTMSGGAGNDTYVVDNAGDVVTELSGQGTDLVLATDSFTLGANVENLKLSGSLDMVGTGNNLSNTIDASAASGNETLDGGAGGTDTLIGGTGNNFFIVHSGTESITLGGSTNTLESADISLNLTNPKFSAFNIATLLGSANLSLTGGTGNDTLTGNDGNNIITGGGGNDTLEGGLGNDTFVVTNTTDVITDIGGTDTVSSSVDFDLSTINGVENLTLTGSAVNGTGNAFDNSLAGDALANVLDGGVGADTMSGGAGNDTYLVDNTGDVIFELAGGGTDVVQSTVSFTLGLNVERLQLLGATDMAGTGNALSNVIDASGASGNETLDGGAGGTDTLIGGTGNNFFIVHSGTEVITLAGVSNTLESSDLSLNLGSANFSAFHIATLLGSANLSLTGGTGNDTLTGNDGNNIITGGAGTDTLEGGLGNDTFVVDTTTDVITDVGGTDTVSSSVAYDLSTAPVTGVENLILTGALAINGAGDGNNNVITGNTAVNILTGGAGNDTLDGKAGADTMIGGTGDDTFFVDNAGDVIQELPGGGNDTVIVAAGVRFVLPSDVENLVQLGNGSGTLIGGSGNDTLTGTPGNDSLNGGGGADTMIGGKGADAYFVDNAGDVIIENPGEGTDKVTITSDALSGFTSFDMSVSAANVEKATVIGTADFTLAGNINDNVLVTGSGNDLLVGGGGHDTLNGGLGNDTYIGDFSDIIIDAGGHDVFFTANHYTLQNGLEDVVVFDPSAPETEFYVKGNAVGNIVDGSGLTHDYTLLGMGGSDTIFGGSGNDTVDGGAGADTMSGGDGDDTFFVDNPGDVVLESAGGGADILTIAATAGTFVLGSTSEIETISLAGGTGQSFTGSDTDNVITTNAFSKIINGMGGNDTITGSGVTDVINGGTGDDIITGNGGLDQLTGGAGQDTFIFKFATAFSHVVTISDFNLSDTGALGTPTTGDVLDISDILTNTTGTGHLEPATDWVRFLDSGANTLVQIDLDGAGTAHHFQTIAVLQHVTGLTDETALLLSGNIEDGGFFQ